MPVKTKVAIAILHQDNRFLLQLRDDLPHILYPGHWGFFGGHLEPGEDPLTAVHRELQEEIGYTASSLQLFDRWECEKAIRYVFQGPLTVPVSALVLTEGQDLGLCTVEDIYRGQRYSEKLGEDRPLGSPHQQILLSFLEQRRMEQAS